MNLNQLTTAELAKAYQAADYLLNLPVRVDEILRVKLDTFRADAAAAKEDRAAHAQDTGRAQLIPVQ
jgi:hypothetical protein